MLRSLDYLEELVVEYDGTRDLYPELEKLQEDLAEIHVEPQSLHVRWPSLGESYAEDGAWYTELEKQRWLRIARKLKAVGTSSKIVEDRANKYDGWIGFLYEMHYHLLPLPDENYAEIYRYHYDSLSHPGSHDCLFVILERDHVIAVQQAGGNSREGYRKTVYEDLDGDRRPDVGFVYTDGFGGRSRSAFHLSDNDNRLWTGAWSITPDGLVPLMREAVNSPRQDGD